MRRLVFIITFLTIGTPAQSQIDYVRYNDDFSYLKADTAQKKGWNKLKYLPLGTKHNISLGGEIREQLQYYGNFNFGDLPSRPNQPVTWQLWHRAMAHANIELGTEMRIFTQAGSTFRFLNTNTPIPEIDENHLSLHQLFGEYHFGKKWMVRIGRQEMSYGSHRLITFREGPNTRLTFDAAAIKFESEKRKLDLIALSPVISRNGVFDDATFKDVIVGAYATEKLVPGRLILQYYSLYFNSHRRKYSYKEGRDSRGIVGFRAYGQNRIVHYEAEATYQFGRFNTLRINAYSLSTDINVDIVPNGRLTTGMAGNYVSGDRDNRDNELNTYNPLFSKPQYGLTSPIGASNIMALNPYMRTSPLKKMNILVGSYLMWRQSNRDGTYAPDGTQLRPRPEKLLISGERRIGTLLLLESNYTVNNHLGFAFDASRFSAGEFLRQSGNGKDITYFSFKISYKF